MSKVQIFVADLGKLVYSQNIKSLSRDNISAFNIRRNNAT